MALPRYYPIPDAEHPDRYVMGGLHPVHLEDSFAQGRYVVKHKLGHGVSSTIWLARDSKLEKYVALKIISADLSARAELKVLNYLNSTFDPNEQGNQYVLRMVDHFEHEGPNGKHQCIVTDLAGPSLASMVVFIYDDEVIPAPIVRQMVPQIAFGVKYLHKRNIAHGDLHPGNILLHSPMFDTWSSQDDVEKFLGTPVKWPLERRGDPPTSPNDPSIPNYLVSYPDPTPLLEHCFKTPEIRITDFSESFIPNITPPHGLHTPHSYRPPEGLLSQLPHPTLEKDVWAMAILCHSLFTGGRGLFLAGDDDKLLVQMVRLLGKFPDPWWSKWNNRHVYFDEEGNFIYSGTEVYLPTDRFSRVRDRAMGQEERGYFEQLLRAATQYATEERITMEEFVNSEWMTKYCLIAQN